MDKKGTKIYVPDTNVLVHDPKAIEILASTDNLVIIPMVVIEELDDLKNHRNEEVAFAARSVSKSLDRYLLDGESLSNGVKLPSGGKVQVDCNISTNKKDRISLEQKKADNRILQFCKNLGNKYPDCEIILVTKDTNMRIKASARGIIFMDYENDQLVKREEDIYSGFIEIRLREENSDALNNLCSKGILAAELLKLEIEQQKIILWPNIGCKIIDRQGKYALAIYKEKAGQFSFCNVKKPEKFPAKEMAPRNDLQALAYAMITDKDIPLTSLIGPAGTGKTLLALLAGEKMVGKGIDQILVIRPMYSVEKQDLGFLPGEEQEKFAPWTEPIIDNMQFILSGDHAEQESPSEANGKKRYQSRNGEVREYIEQGYLQIIPVSHVRGRSIHKSLILVDECQNFTPVTVKTIVSRAAEGTKIVLVGDNTQIDNPYLSRLSNGLVHLIEKKKKSTLCAHLTLKTNERSALSALAEDL